MFMSVLHNIISSSLKNGINLTVYAITNPIVRTTNIIRLGLSSVYKPLFCFSRLLKELPKRTDDLSHF